METLEYPKETKALKDYHCDYCGEKIAKGSKYLNSTHKNENGIYHWKQHKHCAELVEKLKMFDHVDDGEGLTHEDFCETIREKHFEILSDQLPNGQYRDIREQLRHVNFHYMLLFVIRHLNKEQKAADLF